MITTPIDLQTLLPLYLALTLLHMYVCVVGVGVLSGVGVGVLCGVGVGVLCGDGVLEIMFIKSSVIFTNTFPH